EVCQPYASCDQGCYLCRQGPGPLNQDDPPCPIQEQTTCGEVGYSCGGCAIVDTREEERQIERFARPALVCGAEETWYHYTNTSVFMPFERFMRRATIGHQI